MGNAFFEDMQGMCSICGPEAPREEEVTAGQREPYRAQEPPTSAYADTHNAQPPEDTREAEHPNFNLPREDFNLSREDSGSRLAPDAFVPPPQPPPPDSFSTGPSGGGSAGSRGPTGGGGAATATAPTLDVETVVSRLEESEALVYGACFETIACQSMTLETNNVAMRDFVMKYTAITADEVDTQIIKRANHENFTVDRAAFVQIITENAINEGESLAEFLGLALDQETMPSDTCRTGLRAMCHKMQLECPLEDDYERIFDNVMQDAGLTVNMEEWLRYAARVARCVRLLRYPASS